MCGHALSANTTDIFRAEYLEDLNMANWYDYAVLDKTG